MRRLQGRENIQGVSVGNFPAIHHRISRWTSRTPWEAGRRVALRLAPPHNRYDLVAKAIRPVTAIMGDYQGLEYFHNNLMCWKGQVDANDRAFAHTLAYEWFLTQRKEGESNRDLVRHELDRVEDELRDEFPCVLGQIEQWIAEYTEDLYQTTSVQSHFTLFLIPQAISQTLRYRIIQTEEGFREALEHRIPVAIADALDPSFLLLYQNECGPTYDVAHYNSSYYVDSYSVTEYRGRIQKRETTFTMAHRWGLGFETLFRNKEQALEASLCTVVEQFERHIYEAIWTQAIAYAQEGNFQEIRDFHPNYLLLTNMPGIHYQLDEFRYEDVHNIPYTGGEDSIIVLSGPVHISIHTCLKTRREQFQGISNNCMAEVSFSMPPYIWKVE